MFLKIHWIFSPIKSTNPVICFSTGSVNLIWSQQEILPSCDVGSVRRHCGLMVNVLVSRSSGQGSSPGRDILLCPWARHYTCTLTMPLSKQVYKWVLTSLKLVQLCDGLASYPGGVGILLVTSFYRNRNTLLACQWATWLVSRLNLVA